MTRSTKKRAMPKAGIEPRPPTREADALTTRPAGWSDKHEQIGCGELRLTEAPNTLSFSMPLSYCPSKCSSSLLLYSLRGPAVSRPPQQREIRGSIPALFCRVTSVESHLSSHICRVTSVDSYPCPVWAHWPHSALWSPLYSVETVGLESSGIF